MVTIIFRTKIREGKEEKALERLRKMVESVQANEPGALLYILHRSQQDPSEILFLEAYADDAAFQAHMQTPHMAEFQASLDELFDTSQLTIDRLQRVAGFARAGAG